MLASAKVSIKSASSQLEAQGYGHKSNVDEESPEASSLERY